MLNPFNPEQDSDPGGFLAASRFHKRLLENVHNAGVDDRIFQVVQEAFEDALKKEHMMVLPGVAKKYLLARIMKQVLMDMITRLTNTKIA